MKCDNFLESDRRLKGGLLQVALKDSIESVKSVTLPSVEEVTKYLSVRSLSD